jgi:hypothetical protein
MPNAEYGHVLDSLQSRRDIDTAKGIVMVIRRCSAQAAFAELVRVAQSHSVAVSTVASALVDLVGTGGRREDAGPAYAAAHATWGAALLHTFHREG